MGDNSKIEWTEETVNVVTGCTRVSEGCDNCYIERTPPLRMAGRRFDKPGVGGHIPLMFHPERMAIPLRQRKPRRIFLPSLADLFHDDVPGEYIARVFAMMAASPQHTFQITTKRPARMRSLIGGDDGSGHRLIEAATDEETALALYEAEWPLRNVWLGVSVENQKWADIRIPLLLQTPAAVRWISAEPLLGPVDLGIGDPHRGHMSDDVNGHPHPPICLTCSTDDNEVEYFRRDTTDSGINWVVAGGESGPGSRPMAPGWALSLRDQCAAADVPFFFKQWGNWVAPSHMTEDTFAAWDAVNGSGGDHDRPLRVSKKAAGRELDGRTHDEYPQTEPVGVR